MLGALVGCQECPSVRDEFVLGHVTAEHHPGRAARGRGLQHGGMVRQREFGFRGHVSRVVAVERHGHHGATAPGTRLAKVEDTYPAELSGGDNFVAGPLPDDPADAESGEVPEISEREARQELVRVEAELNQRWPETKIDPSLDRIAALATVLGDPQKTYPVLHIAGTNGKGSTARMIDALLTR